MEGVEWLQPLSESVKALRYRSDHMVSDAYDTVSA